MKFKGVFIKINFLSLDINVLGVKLMAIYRSLELINIDKKNSNEMSLEMNTIRILDLKCSKAPEILKHASYQKYFDKKTKWLLFGDSLNNSLSLLKPLDISIDARILIFIKNPDVIWCIYHIKSPALKRNFVIYINLIGNYSMSTGLRMVDPFQSFNYTMDGTVLNVAISVSSSTHSSLF